jgi:hypothetical protein
LTGSTGFFGYFFSGLPEESLEIPTAGDKKPLFQSHDLEALDRL